MYYIGKCAPFSPEYTPDYTYVQRCIQGSKCALFLLILTPEYTPDTPYTYIELIMSI